MNDKKKHECYGPIESVRQEMLRDNSSLEVEDRGAGSAVIKTNTRKLSKIAASSLKPKKFAQLLFRIVQHYQPQTVIELGTSLGITTAYLANGNKKATVYTLEGAASIAAIARKNFAKLSLPDIKLIEGDFALTLPRLLEKMTTVDLVFIDGNHRKGPTLHYFEQLLHHCGHSTILIFDDIHWSAEMEEAWEKIRSHPSVTLSIDLFFIGLVFFDTAFREKQHFKIRF